MIIYFIIFIISFFMALVAEKNFKNKNKKIAIFFSALAIIIPSLLAAYRTIGVGTDTHGYIRWAFKI